MCRKAQRPVTAKRDHRIDAQPVEHPKDLAGLVAVLLRARIRAGGMQDGPTHPIDAAHPVPGQRPAVGGDRRGIVRIDLKEALPAAAETNHVPAEIVGGQGDRTDAGIEAGHIAAAGQNPDLHCAFASFMARPLLTRR